MSPYECGVQPIGDARGRFSVKFYLVAMLFILFDVEAVFLYPWAVILRELKMFGFWEMMVYIAIVLVGPPLCLEKRRARLGSDSRQAGRRLMALAPPITDIEQLKSHPALGPPGGVERLGRAGGEIRSRRAYRSGSRRTQFAKLARYCATPPIALFNYLCDITCVDLVSFRAAV